MRDHEARIRSIKQAKDHSTARANRASPTVGESTTTVGGVTTPVRVNHSTVGTSPTTVGAITSPTVGASPNVSVIPSFVFNPTAGLSPTTVGAITSPKVGASSHAGVIPSFIYNPSAVASLLKLMKVQHLI